MNQIKFITNVDNTIIRIRTSRKFFYRLWFLVSAPFVWLIKGEVNIK